MNKDKIEYTKFIRKHGDCIETSGKKPREIEDKQEFANTLGDVINGLFNMPKKDMMKRNKDE